MRLLAPAAAALVFACVSASAGFAGAPAGATARCRDGSYSFSQHHSGTCSYHGGVAAWLGSASAPAPAPAAPAAAAAPALGATVLLAPRRKSARCKLGPNPDRACSPGAYSRRLTTAVICSPGFRTGTIRNVPQSEKFAVEREYGLRPAYYGSTLEIDHIVSLELGGSNAIANLFPEEANAHPGYHVKDRLENRLHDLVCSGAMPLRTAQERIAANWQALYRSVFGPDSLGASG
jgi:Protein of unknown function (DUF3761)